VDKATFMEQRESVESRIEQDPSLGYPYVRLHDQQDGSGQKVMLRIDLYAVSVIAAVAECEDTFLQDMITDDFGEEDVVADILVTRDLHGRIVFEVLTGNGKQASYGNDR
jgi:hypothetical protein